MSATKNKIEQRHARRADIEKQSKKLRPPSIHSKQAKTEFDKSLSTYVEQFKEECLMITHDVQVMLIAFFNMEQNGLPAYKYLDEAWAATPIDPDRQAELDRRAFEEAEAREKQAKSDKKQGELDGQLKIFDDGSTAEAATDVTTVTDVTPESHRLPDYGNLAELMEGPIVAPFDDAPEPEPEPEEPAPVPSADKSKKKTTPKKAPGRTKKK